MNEPRDEKTPHAVRRHRTRHGLWAGLLGAALVGALVAAHAVTDARRAEAAPVGHGWSGDHARFGWALEGALRWAGADDQQRRAVRGIVADAHAELEPLREEHRQRVAALAEALLAPEVDRTAIEELRRGELELAERASARLTRALAEAADQLSPAQRAELLEMVRFAH